MASVKKAFIHFSHYLSGNLLVQLLGFISFPILTRMLSIDEYGILGIISTTMLLSVAIAKTGLPEGIIRFYKEYSKSLEQRIIFSSTIMVRGLIFSGLTVLLYLAVLGVISKYSTLDNKLIVCFVIMSIVLLVSPLNSIIICLLRVNGKTIFLNVISVFGKVISICLSLSLFVFVVHELYGYFIGIVLAEIIVSITLFFWFFKNYKIVLNKASWPLTSKLVRFGLPLLFTEITFLLLSYADRYMVLAFLGQKHLGLYSVGYNLAMYIGNILTFSFSVAIIPIYVEIFHKKGRKETEEFLKKCMHYILIIIIPTCVGFYAISDDLIVALASQKYSSAAVFSPIILVGTLFLLTNDIFKAGLYLHNKTMIIFIIMLLAVLVNIILNLFLIPKYGVMGAAVSTLISCIISTLLIASLSFRFLLVKIEIKTFFYHTIVSTCMFFVLKLIETQAPWTNVLLKIFVGTLIVGVGIAIREKEIVAKVKEMYKINFGQLN